MNPDNCLTLAGTYGILPSLAQTPPNTQTHTHANLNSIPRRLRLSNPLPKLSLQKASLFFSASHHNMNSIWQLRAKQKEVWARPSLYCRQSNRISLVTTRRAIMAPQKKATPPGWVGNERRWWMEARMCAWSSCLWVLYDQSDGPYVTFRSPTATDTENSWKRFKAVWVAEQQQLMKFTMQMLGDAQQGHRRCYRRCYGCARVEQETNVRRKKSAFIVCRARARRKNGGDKSIRINQMWTLE